MRRSKQLLPPGAIGEPREKLTQTQDAVQQTVKLVAELIKTDGLEDAVRELYSERNYPAIHILAGYNMDKFYSYIIEAFSWSDQPDEPVGDFINYFISLPDAGGYRFLQALTQESYRKNKPISWVANFDTCGKNGLFLNKNGELIFIEGFHEGNEGDMIYIIDGTHVFALANGRKERIQKDKIDAGTISMFEDTTLNTRCKDILAVHDEDSIRENAGSQIKALEADDGGDGFDYNDY